MKGSKKGVVCCAEVWQDSMLVDAVKVSYERRRSRWWCLGGGRKRRMIVSSTFLLEDWQCVPPLGTLRNTSVDVAKVKVGHLEKKDGETPVMVTFEKDGKTVLTREVTLATFLQCVGEGTGKDNDAVLSFSVRGGKLEDAIVTCNGRRLGAGGGHLLAPEDDGVEYDGSGAYHMTAGDFTDLADAWEMETGDDILFIPKAATPKGEGKTSDKESLSHCQDDRDRDPDNRVEVTEYFPDLADAWAIDSDDDNTFMSATDDHVNTSDDYSSPRSDYTRGDNDYKYRRKDVTEYFPDFTNFTDIASNDEDLYFSAESDLDSCDDYNSSAVSTGDECDNEYYESDEEYPAHLGDYIGSIRTEFSVKSKKEEDYFKDIIGVIIIVVNSVLLMYGAWQIYYYDK